METYIVLTGVTLWVAIVGLSPVFIAIQGFGKNFSSNKSSLLASSFTFTFILISIVVDTLINHLNKVDYYLYAVFILVMLSLNGFFVAKTIYNRKVVKETARVLARKKHDDADLQRNKS